MANRCVGSATMWVTAAVLSLPASAAPQTPQAVGGTNHAVPAERTWGSRHVHQDGQPDIQGVWTRRVPDMAGYALEGGPNDDHLLLSRPDALRASSGASVLAEEIEAEVARRRGQRGTIIVDPPDGKVPYQPWAAAKRQDITANHANPRGPGGYQSAVPLLSRWCAARDLSRGYRHSDRSGSGERHPDLRVQPRLSHHSARRRSACWRGHHALDGRFAGPLGRRHARRSTSSEFNRPDVVRPRPGTSTAMRCTSSNATRSFDSATIHYEATITDPNVFTRPWKIAFPLIRNTQRGIRAS